MGLEVWPRNLSSVAKGHSHENTGREKGVGALELVVEPMVVRYDEVLVKGGKLLQSISLLWWGMDPVFFFGMISGPGMSLLNVFILVLYLLMIQFFSMMPLESRFCLLDLR